MNSKLVLLSLLLTGTLAWSDNYKTNSGLINKSKLDKVKRDVERYGQAKMLSLFSYNETNDASLSEILEQAKDGLV
jgi:hypothetical protein